MRSAPRQTIPAFDPVRADELSDLRYSVDVLFPSEEAVMEDLDPAVFGVIVEDESGARRGLLLPDIPGHRLTRNSRWRSPRERPVSIRVKRSSCRVSGLSDSVREFSH